MILIALALACMLTVPLTGGRLTRLAALHLRWLWTAPAALILQIAITEVVPNANHNTLAACHIVSYVLVIAFLVANRSITGMPIIAVGALSNALVIVSNGGVMAASARAQQLAGLTLNSQFHNSVVLVNPRLLFLGDIIPVPGPLPNVLSPGDCVVFLGMLVLLHSQCHWRRNTASEVSEAGIILGAVPMNAALAGPGLMTGGLAMASLAQETTATETPAKSGFFKKAPKTIVAAETVETEAPAKKGLFKKAPKTIVAAETVETEAPAKKGLFKKAPKTIVAAEETPVSVGLITGNRAMESLAAESLEAAAPAKQGFLTKAPKSVVAAEEAPETALEMPRTALESYATSFGIGGLEVSAPQVVARLVPAPAGRSALPDVLPRDEKMLAAQRISRLTWQAGVLGAAIGFFLNRGDRQAA